MPGRAFFSAAFLTLTLKVFSFDSFEISDSLLEKKRKGKKPTTIGVSACLLCWTQYFIWPQKYSCESIFALFQAELPAAFRTSAFSVAQCWLIACSPVCRVFALQMTSVWIILSLPNIPLNVQSFGILLAANRGSGYLSWSYKAALMHQACGLFSLSSEAGASSAIWEASRHIMVSIGLVLIDLPVLFWLRLALYAGHPLADALWAGCACRAAHCITTEVKANRWGKLLGFWVSLRQTSCAGAAVDFCAQRNWIQNVEHRLSILVKGTWGSAILHYAAAGSSRTAGLRRRLYLFSMK